jgi:hypothetical protein
MDQAHQDQTSRCPVCGGSQWWSSRTGWSICAQCYPDALEALQVLAILVDDAPTRGERTPDAAIGRCPTGSLQGIAVTPLSTSRRWDDSE